MTDIAALTQLIEPEALALGFALVRVKMIGGTADPTLQIMAERPDTRQLTIDDCAEPEGRDPFAHEYRLEVSSPGIDRPLTRLQDFADWAGHEARITLTEKLDGRKQFKGDLGEVEGDAVSIVTGDGARHVLPFARVEDAKLIITDRLIAATAPLSIEGADEFEDAAPDAEAEEEN